MRKVDFAVNVDKTVIPHIYMFVFSRLALLYVGIHLFEDRKLL